MDRVSEPIDADDSWAILRGHIPNRNIFPRQAFALERPWVAVPLEPNKVENRACAKTRGYNNRKREFAPVPEYLSQSNLASTPRRIAAPPLRCNACCWWSITRAL
ncbi:hypothetical protein E4U38_003045 [Claviceps purpurea]|nr:hypothetical protein E4U38_003045 [Claviceps purpurea]KAG6247961.1 hypothetical protein E4U23_003401 [Claviceps purpurea]KAG6283086.1 hypothetical protein E4U48_001908 [Claviceps purpurea]KAG6292015.1 hypothetical protein E4U46_000547 [Claviceps purpurea]KAG6308444.1 hypothetical protein E4U45_000984 [Claviceps purpurea]